MNPPDLPGWRDALAQVPGARCGADPVVTPLAGGTSNATFRVATQSGVFVVRLHEPYTLELGVDRRREALLHEAAARAGLASRILAADANGGYLVTEFLTGTPWRESDLEDAARLRQLAQTLTQLHSLPAPVTPPLNLAALLERHVAQLKALDPPTDPHLSSRLARARDILAKQAAAARPGCILHGDLTHTNLIGAAPLRLIDWEYARVGDPLADLACLIAYYPQLLPRAPQLLQQGGLAHSATPCELADLASVYTLASDLWYRRLALARRHPPPAH